MPFSMHYQDDPRSRPAPSRRASGWRGDALILTLCVLGLLLADLFATGGQHTRSIIDGAVGLLRQGGAVVAGLPGR